ncbi:MAG: MFS transporter [Beijerinckiaceae bacterium]|nr:MFS transporter [Beijerinckiaceae bacterium]
MITPLRRALLVLSITQIIAWGSLYYAIALWGPRIAAETGWSDLVLYGGYSLALVGSGLWSPFFGRMIDQRGGRFTMTIGSLIGAGGLALLASAHHEITYALAWAIIGCAMAASLYDPAFATLSRISGDAPTRTRRAISFLTLPGGFASTVFWPLTLFLLQSFDWRQTAWLYAAFLAFICAPLHRFGLPSPDEREPALQHEASTETTRAEPPPITEKSARRTAFLLFALVIAAHGFPTSALSVHIVRLLDLLGLTEAQAVLAASLVGPAQVGARILELLFGRRLSAIGLGLLATSLMPAAFLILIFTTISPGAAVVYGLVYGASNGLVTIARGIVALSLFGHEGYGRTLGLIAAPALAVKAAAPPLFALGLTAFGAGAMLWACLALSLLAFAAMALLAVKRARA